MIELRSGFVFAAVDEQFGARLASLVVNGRERLVTREMTDGDPLRWGSYPMAPWAGRVRAGRFVHDGQEVQLPLRMPPHAIHGTVLDRAWTVVEQGPAHVSVRIDLGPDWPWPGHVEQRIDLDRDGLRCGLSVHSDGPTFPAQVGWHPWFSEDGTAPRLTFAAQAMYRRDDDYITIAEMVRPRPHPWDDCFVGVTDPPRLRYSDGFEMTLMSDCDHWVVFEPGHAVCVEPQSGPPDGFTLRPDVVSQDGPLSRTMTIAFGPAP